MSDRDVYRIYTAHGTQMFLNRLKCLVHRNAYTAATILFPVCARRLDDGIALFTIRDMRIIYIQSIDNAGNVNESDSLVKIDHVDNADGSISIVQSKKFLSARNVGGKFGLVTGIKGLEQFTLERAEFSLTPEFIPPGMIDFDEPSLDRIKPLEDPSVKVPKVSVIIPMFNTEDYIEECLDSVLKQTLRDFEVIVVDDCSTDRSAELVEGMMSKFGGRLKLIRLPKNNGEPGTPRNIGISYAIGEYIYFMDSDDMLMDYALQTLVDAAEKNNADAVYSGTHYTLTEKGKRITKDYLKLTDAVFKPLDMSQRMRDFLVERVFSSAPWKRFIRRDFLVANQIKFPATNFCEDTYISFQCALLAKILVSIPNAVYVYRSRTGSITHNKFSIPKTFTRQIKCVGIVFKSILDGMSRTNFFSRHPPFKFQLFKFFFGRFLTGLGVRHTQKYYVENPMSLLYDEVCKIFSDGADFNDELIAYCLSASITQPDQIAARDQKIEKLKKELTGLS